MKRRPFLRLASLSSLGYGAFSHRSLAEEMPAESLYAKFVPADKELSADWLASLTTRGHKLDAGIRHTKKDGNLDVIGMTVGGICCGTVYLSGDGRLWIWDVFNQHHEGVVKNEGRELPAGLGNIGGSKKMRNRDGSNFIYPPRASDHLNGVNCGISLTHAGVTRPMDATGWDEVEFNGRWPVGTVNYAAQGVPVKVRLDAYSPFIPLNLDESSLPVTIMAYEIENTGSKEAEVTLTGHLDNAVGQFSKLESARYTEKIEPEGAIGLLHGVRGEDPAIRDKQDSGTMAIAWLHPKSAKVENNSVGATVSIPAGGKVTLRFAIAWHFPNISPKLQIGPVKRHYASRFADARAVVAHVAKQFDTLSSATRTWVDTWNDSTLPQWLLDRTILTANTLQTENCFFADGKRFWAWEGIGCCPGTCGHVWEYSQGHARLFPQIERNLREVTDYAIGQKPDGSIAFRGSNAKTVAIDSQTSYILRTLRDHQLSDDPGYLKRVWPATRKALQYLIDFDSKDGRGGLDGLLDGEQHNTLDAEWYGKVHVLCSMYLAALRAGEELAKDAGDAEFAKTTRAIYEKGRENIAKLFNGEFYEQIEDPDRLNKIGVGKGCYIDQVMGQFWANQTGLGRLYNAGHQKSALRALWKYNFVPDYGSFRKGFTMGRHYASSGDSGLLMCTWPKGGLRPDFMKHWQYAYFNEFMTGFEYQAAAHMVAEGDEDLVRYGLAITRAIHDRYSATRGRNPYNEIECSDHYARAGASYGVFLAACGFHYDQAKALLRFHPVIQKENFKAPFLTSAGWGTFTQSAQGASITLTHGSLRLRTVELPAFDGKKLRLTRNGQPAPDGEIILNRGDRLEWTVIV